MSIAQEKLTKNEIYSMICYGEENRNKIITNFDSSVVVLVDSLKVLKTDTIGIFSWTSHGSFLKSNVSKCELSLWTAYIHWIKNGVTYYQKISENCVFGPKVIKSSKLIDFYINNKIAINENRIMPVITDVSMNEKGKYIITSVLTSSTAAYKIYCEFGGNSTIKTFENYEIDNEENIFYNENNNSVIKTWWELIEGQIAEIEKE
ncbi:MAG: hypothetical protein ABFS35_23810 [Bacteroidota bacterium]